MGDEETKSGNEDRSLTVLQTVRCLECGEVYSKPAAGGTVLANPGCPECGYVGWLSTAIPVSEVDEPLRFASGRQRRQSA